MTEVEVIDRDRLIALVMEINHKLERLDEKLERLERQVENKSKQYCRACAGDGTIGMCGRTCDACNGKGF